MLIQNKDLCLKIRCHNDMLIAMLFPEIFGTMLNFQGKGGNFILKLGQGVIRTLGNFNTQLGLSFHLPFLFVYWIMGFCSVPTQQNLKHGFLQNLNAPEVSGAAWKKCMRHR